MRRRVLAGIAVTAAALTAALGATGAATADRGSEGLRPAGQPSITLAPSSSFNGGGLCCYEYAGF
ncbi:hypothetical protein [Streptosporangium sp. NPDC003464]